MILLAFMKWQAYYTHYINFTYNTNAVATKYKAIINPFFLYFFFNLITHFNETLNRKFSIRRLTLLQQPGGRRGGLSKQWQTVPSSSCFFLLYLKLCSSPGGSLNSYFLIFGGEKSTHFEHFWWCQIHLWEFWHIFSSHLEARIKPGDISYSLFHFSPHFVSWHDQKQSVDWESQVSWG